MMSAQLCSAANPHRTKPTRVNRYSVLLLGIQCARLTRPLAPKIFSKDGARDRVPAEKKSLTLRLPVIFFSAVPPVTLYAAHNKTSWQFPCTCCPLLSPHGRYCFIPHGMASYVQLGVQLRHTPMHNPILYMLRAARSYLLP